MEKINIKNRKGQKIVVLVEETPDARGLAFVMHGLGGFKEQKHVETFAQAFKEMGYTTVRFDTTNTLGESDGSFESATTTNYYHDLEDVISWANTQPWYQEPFCLCGHSLGGISTTLYAETNPEKIKALAPISSVISGKLSIDTPSNKEWQRTGWREERSVSKPNVIKRLPWSHMEDRQQYDLLPNADKLTMPVLLIVGDQDNSTPLEHQQLLFSAIPGNKKELYIIKGAPHTFRDSEHLDEIKQIFKNWIAKL